MNAHKISVVHHFQLLVAIHQALGYWQFFISINDKNVKNEKKNKKNESLSKHENYVKRRCSCFSNERQKKCEKQQTR